MSKILRFFRVLLNLFSGDKTYEEVPLDRKYHFTVYVKDAIIRVDVQELRYVYFSNRVLFPWRKKITMFKVTSTPIGVKNPKLIKFLNEPMYIPKLISSFNDEKHQLNAILVAYMDVLIRKIK